MDQQPSSWQQILQLQLCCQQKRTKAYNRQDIRAQLVSLHIKPTREQELRTFWKKERGVQSLAMLHRFSNFACVFPRYRDLGYLRQQMTVRTPTANRSSYAYAMSSVWCLLSGATMLNPSLLKAGHLWLISRCCVAACLQAACRTCLLRTTAEKISPGES